MLNLILFGTPGSGKGTQSVKIAEEFTLGHISTGDIFRNEIKNKTELGLKVQSIIERGCLVPDELLIEILDNAMKKFDGINGFVFDGFPRTITQAKELDDLLGLSNDCVTLVLALEVNNDEVLQRLLKRALHEGRKDDTEEVIKKRLDVYYLQTSPLIDYYKNQGKYKTVEGIGSVDEIFTNICKVIRNCL